MAEEEEFRDRLESNASNVSNVHEVEIPQDESHPKFSWRKLWAFTGPGWLMSIAYLDPGNLESDLQAGAIGGYRLLWVLWWATVAGLLLQILAARLGVVTGKHLAQICREQYPKPAAMTLWIMTELAIIGSDIQEVIGFAIGLQVLFGLKLWIGVLITAIDTFSFLSIHLLGIRKLEAFFCFLISVMAICFFIEFFLSEPDAAAFFQGLIVPSVPNSAITQAVGMVGAVIMPHNIFLHSALVQSRDVDKKNKSAVKEANKYFSIEASVALFVSFLINAAVVTVFAAHFYGHDSISLRLAGDALGNTLGPLAKIVWGVGLLAAGQSSTMTGTYAGQFVMEGFINLKVKAWVRVAITRSVAIIPAVIVALIAGDNFDDMNEWLNVLQSVQLPFALLPLMKLTNSSRVMGDFCSPLSLKVLGGLCAIGVMAINIWLVADFAIDLPSASSYTPMWVVVGLFYFGFLLYICFHKILTSEELESGETGVPPLINSLKKCVSPKTKPTEDAKEPLMA